MKMKTHVQTVLDIRKIATRLERDRCLKIVDDVIEPSDEMPDQIWKFMKMNDRAAVIQLVQRIVRDTKSGIRKRILDDLNHNTLG
jgi:hypothetical protein